MADTGYRSIEVQAINYSRADLTISSAGVLNNAAAWVSGEEPKVGGILPQYEAQLWGVLTNDPTKNADARVTLIGVGKTPVVIQFSNAFTGESKVTLVGNEYVTGTVTKIDTGSLLHTQYQVQLTPVLHDFPAEHLISNGVRGAKHHTKA